MTESRDFSWQEIVDRLQHAARELRSVAGQQREANADEDVAAARLKEDVTRLEQSAEKLRSMLASGFDAQRGEFNASVDREQAERMSGQLKAALYDLAGFARSVTSDLGTAAASGYTQAQPELKSAIRTLEDVASSAGAWVRTVIDPSSESREDQKGTGRQPLDEL